MSVFTRYLFTTNSNKEQFSFFNLFLFSKQLRRLRGKKQVFSLIEPEDNIKYDYVHERLTHSLEVLSIAREIIDKVCEEDYEISVDDDLCVCKICYSESLIEAIAISHDFGHTPFGHVGETALSDLICGKNLKMVNRKCNPSNRSRPLFKHNYYSAILLSREYNECPAEIIDGVLKHSDTSKLNGEIISDPSLFGAHIFLPKSLKTNNNYLKRDYSFSLEGQIVAIADEIAQVLSDIEDSKIVLNNLFARDVNNVNNVLFKSKESSLKTYLNKIHHFLVNGVVIQSKLLLKKYLEDNYHAIPSTNILKFNEAVIDFTNSSKQVMETIKESRAKVLHNDKKVLLQNSISYLVIFRIFDYIIGNPIILYDINEKAIEPIINGFVDIRNNSKNKKYNRFEELKKYLSEDDTFVIGLLNDMIRTNRDCGVNVSKTNKESLSYLMRYLVSYYFEKYGDNLVLDALSRCLLREIAFSIAKMTDKYAFNLFAKSFSSRFRKRRIKAYIKKSCLLSVEN